MGYANGGTVDTILKNGTDGVFVTDDRIAVLLPNSGVVDSTFLIMADLTTGGLDTVTADSGGLYFSLCATPKGDSLAYAFYRTGHFKDSNQIWLIGADGLGKRLLATGGIEYLGGRMSQLRFSHDGSSILFYPVYGQSGPGWFKPDLLLSVC